MRAKSTAEQTNTHTHTHLQPPGAAETRTPRPPPLGHHAPSPHAMRAALVCKGRRRQPPIAAAAAAQFPRARAAHLEPPKKHTTLGLAPHWAAGARGERPRLQLGQRQGMWNACAHTLNAPAQAQPHQRALDRVGGPERARRKRYQAGCARAGMHCKRCPLCAATASTSENTASASHWYERLVQPRKGTPLT